MTPPRLEQCARCGRLRRLGFLRFDRDRQDWLCRATASCKVERRRQQRASTQLRESPDE